MSLIKKPTKLELEGVGALTIRPGDYLTQGGEGAIYRKGDRVLKLALDQATFANAGTPEKVALLRKHLSHPSIVVPSGLVRDSKGKPIGFHLPYVDGEPYPRLFTNDWRNKHGWTDASVTHLTTGMHEVVTHAHTGGALMVDANELNWLADVSDVRRPVPKIIDVDAWQIGQFKADKIMPSITDWHAGVTKNGSLQPSTQADWFAWGVVTFSLYTGTHPYKGKLDGYKVGELERRMKDNASVFGPTVRLNKNVRDFGVIPGPLLDWYRATFEEGERTLPPSPTKTGAANTTLNRVMRAVTTVTGGLVYEKIFQLSGEKIVSVWSCGVVRTDAQNLYEVGSTRKITSTQGTRTAVVARNNGYLIVEQVGSEWKWRFVTKGGVEHELAFTLPIQAVIRSGERLFVTTETELVEVTLQAFAQPVLTAGKRWQILGNSTTWLSGFGVSDVLGAMHLVLPTGDDGVQLIRAAELDGHRIITGRAAGRIASIITVDTRGQYHEFVFAGDANWSRYSVTTTDRDGPEQNLAVLPKGVTAAIREDGELVIEVPTQGTQKVVHDKDIATTMQLTHIDNQVVYRHDGALWSLRMT